MGPVAAIVSVYSKYATFSGRASRSEYWWIALFWIIGLFATAVLDRFLGLSLFLLIFVIGSALPSMAVSVRRLHDSDHSGWMYLLFFLPLVGYIVTLVFMVLKSTEGHNRFGPNPVTGSPEEVF